MPADDDVLELFPWRDEAVADERFDDFWLLIVVEAFCWRTFARRFLNQTWNEQEKKYRLSISLLFIYDIDVDLLSEAISMH